MANFPLLLASLADEEPIYAATFRQICEMLAKCANFAEGSSHELVGTIEVTGEDAAIHLIDGAVLKADGDGSIIASGSSASLIANLSAQVSLEVVGEYAKVYFGPDKLPTVSARTLTSTFSGDWTPGITGDGWTYDSEVFRWRTTETTQLLIGRRTKVQAGATVSAVSVTIDGYAHGSWPPESMPKIEVYKISTYGGALSLLGTTTDNSAQGVYESEHEIEVTGLSEEFDADEELGVLFYSESGTNAVAGTLVIGARYDASYTEIRPG